MSKVLIRAIALGVLIGTPTLLPAQQAGDDVRTTRADRDDHGEWGWLGLLGLAGLLGLKRKDRDVHMHRNERAAAR